MNTPVLVIAFNRPSTLRVLLEQLRSVGATQVFFAVDGPRTTRPEDGPKVAEVKALIRDFFEPSPERCLFQTENLGIRRGPPAAITWFFSHVSEGIILEDDCIPGDDFFPFMAWGLTQYRDQPRVKLLAGFNRFGDIGGPSSFQFIKSAMIWGWASWRRAWAEYDPNFELWSQEQNRRKLRLWLGSFPVWDYWREAVEMVRQGQLVTWDVAWCWSVFLGKGLVVMPRTSLVRNIGFSGDGTNTTGGVGSDERSQVSAGSLKPPYLPPRRQEPNLSLQGRIDRKEFWRTDLLLTTRLKHRLKSLLVGKHVS